MSKVFFVKDGTGDSASGRGYDVPFSLISAKLGARRTKYFHSPPPPFNAQAGPAGYRDPKHVVVEILEGESSDAFSSAGYYYILDLTPEECRKLLGITS
jgi:hypothetical protein